MEECAEVAHAASKSLRFGLDDAEPGQPHSNRERLVQELQDLRGVVVLLNREGALSGAISDEGAVEAKIEKVEKYLHLSRGCGTLD
jgi:hypothetical protein